MAAADVSALISAASSPDPTPSPTPAPAETEAPVEAPESTDFAETPETETPDAGEGAPEADAAGEKPVDARTNPAQIRQALKEFRDAKPENAPIARELNNAYGRYTAYKSVFPKVADAQNAKAILDAVGGNDGVAQLQSTIKSVNETDALLYAGDGAVVKNLYEDFKREGKQANFGKLASPFLDTLRQNDEPAYFNAIRPHFFQGLVDVNLPGVLQSLQKALTSETPNLPVARELLTEMTNWFSKLRDSVETGDKSKLDPERQAFEKERTEFQTQKQKEFQNEVNGEWNRVNASTLGAALKQYTKLPFAKNWTDATKVSVAREIIGTLTEELSGDKSYQSQMDAFWSSKSPERSKIISFHKAKVESVAQRIVKSVLDARYPGFQKAGTVKPKPAGSPGSPAPTAPGGPIFVSAKPDGNLIDWDKDPTRMLFATGKAYLRNGKFVTWAAKTRR